MIFKKVSTPHATDIQARPIPTSKCHTTRAAISPTRERVPPGGRKMISTIRARLCCFHPYLVVMWGVVLWDNFSFSQFQSFTFLLNNNHVLCVCTYEGRPCCLRDVTQNAPSLGLYREFINNVHKTFSD